MGKQNWNNLLGYIKRKLGVPFNMIELTDNDIYDTISEDVLPAMSQYIGKKIWIYLTESNRVAMDSPERGEFMYQIPTPENYNLIDIYQVYYHKDTMGSLGGYRGLVHVADPRDVVMSNAFLDMIASLDVVQAFHFIAPNKIYFEQTLQGNPVWLECKTEHTDLDTIPSDVYQEILKPWALAEVLENVASIRKKYRTVSSPFGNIELNADELEQKAQAIKQGIQEKLDNMPPDHLVYIF